MSTEIHQSNVVIIGAGVSGLTAAYHLLLKDQRTNFVVLEATDCVGGRTCGKSLKCASGTAEWDLGGQWVGTCQPHIMKLLQQLGLEWYEQHTDGIKVMQIGSNKVSTYKSHIPSLPLHALIDLHLLIRKIERLAKKMSVINPCECDKAAEWDNMTLHTFVINNSWTRGAREAMAIAGRTIFGQEMSNMSMLFFLLYVAAAGGLDPIISAKMGVGGQEYRIKEGAFKICEKLKEKIGEEQVHFCQPVLRIEQIEDGVTVHTETGRIYKCQRVIMAIPPNQIARIHFNPELPIEKQHVFNRMPVGNLTKVIVTYQKAFWREKGYSGEVVTNGGVTSTAGISRGPLCVVLDATSFNGDPALVSFIGGDQQVEYATMSSHLRKTAVLHNLAACLGKEALDCIDYVEKNWNKEPYTGGCPVCVGTPGMMTYMAQALREPFDRVHFAGTESATVWCGFLNGAVQAGYRAANEILYNLQPQVVDASDLEDTCYATSTKMTSSSSSFFHEAIQPHVLRWTIGLAAVFVALAVGKKAYFRIAL